MRKGEEGGGRRRKEKEETRGRRNEEEGVGRVRNRRDQIQRPSRASKGKLCFHVFFQRCPKSLVCGKTIPNVMPQIHSVKTWEGNSAYLKRADDGDLDIHMSTQQPSVQLAVEKIHFTEKQH